MQGITNITTAGVNKRWLNSQFAAPRSEKRYTAMRFIPKTLHIFLVFQFFIITGLALAETADLVLIEKVKRRLTLMSGTKQLAQYSVALGGEPVGAKNCQGDNKTPEGTYKIASRNSKSTFYRSLRVSYPNEADRQNSKRLGCSPGGDIMIHGLPNGRGWIGSAHRLKDWTLGCIAVTNSEIDEIWRLVPDGAIVRIVP